MGLRHIDTGAMYRSIALLALRSGVDTGDESKLAELAEKAEIAFEEAGDGGQSVAVNGDDVTADIRTPEVTQAVSAVSAHLGVRRAMVRAQRRLAAGGGAVLEGRDIGTVVLPGADVKVYLDATTRVRAERRLRDLQQQGVESSVDEVENDIVQRDKLDSERGESPLKRAVGAVTVDTSNLTIEGQVDRVVEIARRAAEHLEALSVKQDSKSTARRIRFAYGAAQAFIRLVMKLFFRLKIYRKLKADYEENYIYACNHLAYADPPFVGSTLNREVHYLAKGSLFRNPAFGWLIRTFNAIPMRRGIFDREAMDLALDLLKKKRSVMIFPEGGRVFGGKLGSAKSGVGYLAVNSGVAVVPVYVRGTNQLWKCFLGQARLEVSQGRPIRIDRHLIEEFKNKDSYRTLGEMVMDAIAALRDEREADD